VARINIEDKLYKDQRFTNLCIRLGSKWAALGALAEAWSLAQDFVTLENPKGLVPLSDWKKKRACQDIIAEGLGEIVAVAGIDAVYLSGAEEQFAWLIAAQEKGRKGGLAKAASSANPSQPPGSPSLPSSSSSSSSSRVLDINSSRPNWDTEARRLLTAIKKYGTGNKERKAMQAELGDLFKIACKAPGGIGSIRAMPANDFTVRNVAGILAAVADSMGSAS
jgi:hypothetical protein